MNDIKIEQIAKSIVDLVEKTDITPEDKEKVIIELLKSIIKYNSPEKKYTINDVFDVFFKIELPTSTTKEYEECLANYFGIFFEDNSFTIAKVDEKIDVIDEEFHEYKYHWCLRNIVTNFLIDEAVCNDTFARESTPDWRFKEHGKEIMKGTGKQFYFIRLDTLLSHVINHQENQKAYTTIDLGNLQKIISEINKWLDENSSFTEQVFFKKNNSFNKTMKR